MERNNKIISAFLVAFILLSSIPFMPQAKIDNFIYSAKSGILYGDVNGNNTIELNDALLALQHHVGKTTLDSTQIIIGNVNGDNIVNLSDALLILQFFVGKIYSFPVGEVYEPSINDSSSEENSTDENSKDDTLDPDISQPEDLNFVPVSSDDYCAYKQLNIVQQSVYNIAYENVKDASVEAFSVGSARTVSITDMMIGVQAMIYDHPDLFWTMTSFAYSDKNYGNRLVQFYNNTSGESTYIYEPSEIENMKVVLDAKIEEIFASTLNSSMSESEIALALHDWLVENTIYNSEAVNDSNAHRDAWSAYGALVDGTAVCEGLSKAYQLLLYRAGINCGLAVGPGHMWNYVCIDNEWYYTDVTWADLDLPGIPLYHFYNQTTEVMSNSRTFCPNISDLSKAELDSIVSSGLLNFNLNIPIATATDANWFIENGFYYNDITEFQNSINDRIADQANKGEKYIQFMIAGVYFDSFDKINEYVKYYINMSEVNSKILLYENMIFSYVKRYRPNGSGFLITW